MSTNNWWALRNKFIQSVPANVTASYLSAVLPMNQQSATNNLLRPLKRIGLVDQENKPTERAFKWRDDDQYREACEEIRREVYPQELLDAFSASDINRPAVERWFRNNARVGENAAGKLTTFYLLLVNADPTSKTRMQVPGKDQSKHKKIGATPKKRQPLHRKIITPLVHLLHLKKSLPGRTRSMMGHLCI